MWPMRGAEFSARYLSLTGSASDRGQLGRPHDGAIGRSGRRQSVLGDGQPRRPAAWRAGKSRGGDAVTRCICRRTACGRPRTRSGGLDPHACRPEESTVHASRVVGGVVPSWRIRHGQVLVKSLGCRTGEGAQARPLRRDCTGIHGIARRST